MIGGIPMRVFMAEADWRIRPFAKHWDDAMPINWLGQVVLLVVGVSLSINSVVAIMRFKMSLPNVHLVDGQIIEVRQREGGDMIAYVPVIRYLWQEKPVEFENSLGSFERARWNVGDSVWVRLDRGKPELHDPELNINLYICLLLFGMLIVLSSFASEINFGK